jgi:hypothetical protein
MRRAHPSHTPAPYVSVMVFAPHVSVNVFALHVSVMVFVGAALVAARLNA